MLANKLMSALSGGAEDKLYVDDVFSIFTRTGTGTDVTVPTGIDMTKGYMLWSKGRSGATDHAIYDSARGATLDLASNTTAAQTTQATGLKSVSTTGHTVGSLAKMNTSAAAYVDYVFAKAPKFFDVVTYTGDGVDGRKIPHELNALCGMIVIKRTDAVSDWKVCLWNANAVLNSAAGSIDPVISSNGYSAGSSTSHFELRQHLGDMSAVNAIGGKYVAYLFANDTTADGIIKGGYYSGNGSAAGPIVSLGWEPQWLLIKSATGTGNWQIIDSMRGMPVGSADATLQANLSGAESSVDYVSPTATGFQITSTSSEVNTNGSTYIYLAIRRSNKPPTTGTEVFQAVNYAGNGGVNSISAGSMKHVDTAIWYSRNMNEAPCILNRMLGVGASMDTNSTTAEATFAGGPYFDVMGGLRFTNGSYNSAGNQGMWCFKRAPGFFDVVCYAGDGVFGRGVINHSLGVAPEFMIVKCRNSVNYWGVYHAAVGPTKYLKLETTEVPTTSIDAWYDTAPNATGFRVGGGTWVNQSTTNYVAYLFATLPGISKVGNYTGNGTTQTINCGFTTGARFILIKRTDSTGDWYVWDRTNGIIAGNDPHISMNSATNPVTTDDSVDPVNSGFTINQNAATNINVSGGQYIFLALS